MHEMALAEAIVQLVDEAAQGCARVRTIYLEIGRLAAVEQDALRFCFESVAQHSAAQGARLEIVDVDGCGRCSECGGEVPIAALYDPCPLCGSYRVEVVSGDEMRVKELEVE